MDEVVDDGDVLAEVKLAATIRKFLPSIPSLVIRLIRMNRTQMVSSYCCKKP